MPRADTSRPRLRPAVVALATALGLASAAGMAQAQSLQALYDAARAYDVVYQSARSQAESTVYKAEQSRALKRPNLNLTGNLARVNSDTPFSSTLNSNTTSASVGVALTQSLFNRPNDKIIAQAERGIEVGNAQLAAAEQDVIVRVAQAYFDVLSATDALDTVRTGKRAIAEQLASAKRNFEVGTATITDTREAQARFDLSTAQELAADNDLNVKRLALDQLVGQKGVSPKPLAQPVLLPPVAPADVEAWVTQAEGASPTLRQARLALDVARLETEKARAGSLPTAALSAGFTEAHTRLAASAKVGNNVVGIGPNTGNGLSSNIALQMSMPLYSGGLIQNRLKETLSLEDKAQSDLEAARRSLAQGTRAAYFGVQSLLGQVKALEAAESSSKLALEATQLGYKVGVRVNLDVLNAQTQLYQAQRDLAKARYDTLVNGLKLRQAAGVLQPADVGAVDALLAR